MPQRRTQMTTSQRIIHIQCTLEKIVRQIEEPCWVKAGFVSEKTGWDHEKLRQARNQGIVVFQKRDTGFWYDIKSINPIFFIK
jgi:hypothetical protein